MVLLNISLCVSPHIFRGTCGPHTQAQMGKGMERVINKDLVNCQGWQSSLYGLVSAMCCYLLAASFKGANSFNHFSVAGVANFAGACGFRHSCVAGRQSCSAQLQGRVTDGLTLAFSRHQLS